MIIAGINFDNYTDSYGTIVQKNGDTLDACQRTFSAATLAGILGEDIGPIVGKFLEDKIYRLKRHPTENPNTTSRDQTIPFLCYLAIAGYSFTAKNYFNEIKKNGYKHFNTIGLDGKTTKYPDIVTPLELGMMFRAMNKHTWALYILDWFFFIDMVLNFFETWDSQQNYIPLLLTSLKVKPTFISRLAFKLYYKTDWLRRVSYYCSEENGNNGILPMITIYKEAMLEVFHAGSL